MTESFDFTAHESLFHEAISAKWEIQFFHASHECLVPLLRRFVDDEDPRVRSRALRCPDVWETEEARAALRTVVSEGSPHWFSHWLGAFHADPVATQHAATAIPVGHIGWMHSLVPILLQSSVDAAATSQALVDVLATWTKDRKRRQPVGDRIVTAIALTPGVDPKVLDKLHQRARKNLDASWAVALGLAGHARTAEWLNERDTLLAFQNASAKGCVFELVGERAHALVDEIVLDAHSPVPRAGLFPLVHRQGRWTPEHAESLVRTLLENPRVIDPADLAYLPILDRLLVEQVEQAERDASSPLLGIFLREQPSEMPNFEEHFRPWARSPESIAKFLEGLQWSQIPQLSGLRHQLTRVPERAEAALPLLEDSPNPITQLARRVLAREPHISMQKGVTELERLEALARTLGLPVEGVHRGDTTASVQVSSTPHPDLTSKAGREDARRRARDPQTRPALLELAKDGPAKVRASADELLRLLDGRDPWVVEQEAQALEHLGEHGDRARELLASGRVDGLDLRAIADRDGEGVLAALAVIAADFVWSSSFHLKTRYGGSPPSDLSKYAVSRLAADEVAPGAFQWSVVADEARFHGVDGSVFHRYVAAVYSSGLAARAKTTAPVALEMLGSSKSGHRKRAAEILLLARGPTTRGLPGLLERPKHAMAAAKLAQQAGWPELAKPLRSALEARPSAKLRAELEKALAACGG